MSTIITKGYGLAREAIITKGYGRRIEAIVEEAVRRAGARRGGSKSRRRKEEQCDEFIIDVCLLEVNSEKFIDPIRAHIQESIERDGNLSIKVHSVTVQQHPVNPSDVVVKVRFLPPKKKA